MFTRERRHIALTAQKLEPEFCRQLAHKLLVGVSFGPANPVIEVDRRQHHAQLAAQLQQHPQQGHRIGPARDRHPHPLTRFEQGILGDELGNDFNHRSPREMVSEIAADKMPMAGFLAAGPLPPGL